MSLLDQLSSLCFSSNPQSYDSSLPQFNDSKAQVSQPYKTIEPYLHNQQKRSQSVNKQSHVYVSQQNMIKLFDDNQGLSNWKYAKTDRKAMNNHQARTVAPNSQKKNTVSLFDQCQTSTHQNKFMKLTKMSYLIKNKLRKINYQLFVRLQQYVKAIKIEQQEILKQKQITTANNIQKGVQKLQQTIDIIHLKYFQPSQQSLTHQNTILKLNQAFQKIKSIFKLYQNLSLIQKNRKKIIYRFFLLRIQNFHKRTIKIQLFEGILENLVQKKLRICKNELFGIMRNMPRGINTQQLQINKKQSQVSKDQQLYEQGLINMQQENDILQPQCSHKLPQVKAPLYLSFNLLLSSSIPRSFFQDNFMQFVLAQPYQQNISLKLHPSKSHEQQINLNDCIDNGHLMMNLMKTNTKFQKQLQNLTISKINSIQNSSLNSSGLVYDNFILPQFNNELASVKNNGQQKQQLSQQQKMITMRKSCKPYQNIIKQIKKPRTSLVITKRKQSLNDINNLFNSEKTMMFRKQVKSITNSRTKITSQKKSISDRQIIKKMLEQLNRKLQRQNQTLLKNQSNKKQDGPNRKEEGSNKMENNAQKSAKNVERKKSNSQFYNADVRFSQQSGKKQLRERANNEDNYKKQLISDRKYQKSNKDINKDKKSKNSQNCFMSVTLNQKSNQKIPYKQQKNQLYDSNKPQYSRPYEQNLREQISYNSSTYPVLHPSPETNLPQRNYNIYKPSSSSFKIDLKSDVNSRFVNQKGVKVFFQSTFDNISKQKKTQIQSRPKESYWKQNLVMASDNQYTVGIKQTQEHKKIKNYQQFKDNFNLQSNIIQKLFIGDQFQTKEGSNIQVCGQDNKFGQYARLPPSHPYLCENEQEMGQCYYKFQQPQNAADSSIQGSECFYTGSKINYLRQNSIRESLQKRKRSFERSRGEWDVMFEKQKSKFLKNQQTKNSSTKKSPINSTIKGGIRNKDEQSQNINRQDKKQCSSESSSLLLKLFKPVKSQLTLTNPTSAERGVNKPSAYQKINSSSNGATTKRNVYRVGK